MSFDWHIIGKEISSRYEEMEYHCCYNTEQYIDDCRTLFMELQCKAKKHLRLERDLSDWILMLRDVFQGHRSVLTRLFNVTNHSNGVDMFIEYCNYYHSYWLDTKDADIPIHLSDRILCTLYSLLPIMAKNEAWAMVVENMIGPCALLPQMLHMAKLAGSCPSAMVIMADSDLNAVVQALIRSRHTYFNVTRVLVQEPIKEQLQFFMLEMLKDDEYRTELLSNLFVFRNTEEALGNLNSKDKFKAISIWSENIVAAKKFSANTETDTIWINTLGQVDFGLHSISFPILSRPFFTFWETHLSDDNWQSTPMKKGKKFDLFYGGKWQSPIDGKYWTNQAGDSFAEAGVKDFNNCAKAAHGAFKIWRCKKLSQRVKIIKSFAERLRANGESEFADTVLQLLDRPLEFGTLLSIVRDGEAEILTTPEPVGVVAISSMDQKMLLEKLTIASVTGNVVIVVLNSKSSVSFAQYCDMLGSYGFPPGVINCLFTTDSLTYAKHEYIDQILAGVDESPNLKFFDSYKHKTSENIYNNYFITVTKPKSVWVQLG